MHRLYTTGGIARGFERNPVAATTRRVKEEVAHEIDAGAGHRWPGTPDLSWPPAPAERAIDERTRTLVYVDRSPIHGKGLFARQQIPAGTYIGRYLGPEAQRNGSHVLWVEEGTGWVGRRGFNRLRYLNHDPRPNAEFDGFDLYASRTIRTGQEITIDYHWD